jgi:hypothetical protein
MNYSNHHAVMTRKVAGYDTYTCRRALIDCHDTLDAQGPGIAEDYAVKLWAEIDALRERQLKISKVAA